MSWHFSRALVEAYSEANSLDGEPSVPSSGTPTPQAFLSPDRMMAFSRLSRFGMTFVVANSECRYRMDAWIKNTDTAKCGTALSAAHHLHRETRGQCNNAAQTLVVARCRQGKRNGHVQSAERRSPHRAQDTKPVPANAGRRSGSRAEPLIQWSKSGSGLRCFAAQPSPDAFATRQTAPPHCLDIQSRNYGHTLRRISPPGCLGKTTEREWTNGA